MYLESWFKTYLNLTLVVKSQKLYRQHSYSPYQQKLFDLCIKFQKDGMGYRRISQQLNELGFKSIRGKELKQKLNRFPNINYKKSIQDAIKSIPVSNNDIILITGSLYLAGEVLNLN